MKSGTKKLVISALMAALVCAATMVIRIPVPSGYINLGDGIVLLCGWLLGPVYGAFAAGVGSALADLIGYPIYAPATFVIKALCAFAAYMVYRAASYKKIGIWGVIISAVTAELIMVFGYYLYEAMLLKSFAGALVSLYPNLIQGAGGVIFGVVVFSVLSKNPFINKHFK